MRHTFNNIVFSRSLLIKSIIIKNLVVIRKIDMKLINVVIGFEETKRMREFSLLMNPQKAKILVCFLPCII